MILEYSLMGRGVILVTFFGFIMSLPVIAGVQDSSWISVLCTYSIPNENSGESKTVIKRYSGQVSSFTEITRTDAPDNLKFILHLYINREDQSVRDSNKQQVFPLWPRHVRQPQAQGKFEGDDFVMYYPSTGNDIFKIKFIGKDYSSSKIFIKHKGAIAHIDGSCQTEQIDKCVLFPSVCRPSSNRGF